MIFGFSLDLFVFSMGFLGSMMHSSMITLALDSSLSLFWLVLDMFIVGCSIVGLGVGKVSLIRSSSIVRSRRDEKLDNDEPGSGSSSPTDSSLSLVGRDEPNLAR